MPSAGSGLDPEECAVIGLFYHDASPEMAIWTSNGGTPRSARSALMVSSMCLSSRHASRQARWAAGAGGVQADLDPIARDDGLVRDRDAVCGGHHGRGLPSSGRTAFQSGSGPICRINSRVTHTLLSAAQSTAGRGYSRVTPGRTRATARYPPWRGKSPARPGRDRSSSG
jgi:hypothetical protein